MKSSQRLGGWIKRMQCPECNRNVIFPWQATRNIESYGESWINIRCDKCGVTLKVHGSLHVIFSHPLVTKEDPDWR